MNYWNDRFEGLAGAMDVTVSGSWFDGGNGASEGHVIATLDETPEDFMCQLRAIHEAVELWRSNHGVENATCVFRRYFLSDAANQDFLLRKFSDEGKDGVVSVVGQPPLNRTKVAIWLYYRQGHSDGHYRQYWYTGRSEPAGDSAAQTRGLFEVYRKYLAGKELNIRDHCLRTWLFVRDIDVNYRGVVEARREFFRSQGLTELTHYIASTGIGGCSAGIGSCLAMDAYAVSRLCPEQIRYLKATDHLNPTWEYGVTFERGVSVLYGDRKQAYISGTASIDSKGAVVGAGDINVQLGRMWDNVQALLGEGGYDSCDMAQMIVYMRDAGDYRRVEDFFIRNLPRVPCVIVWAPVCRPKWLVEMECIAIRRERHAGYADFC